MSRKILMVMAAFLVIAGVVWTAGNSQEQNANDVDAAYKRAMEERQELENIEDRLVVTRRFVDQFPESKYTARLLGHVFYYLGEKMGDKPGAIAYAEKIRGKVSDPAILRAIDKEMMMMYGNAGMEDRMMALAVRFDEQGEMKFGDYWDLVEYGVEAKNWKMVRAYCEKARPLATVEAYRAEYPDYEFTDEEAVSAAANRRAMIIVKDGWAQANTGRVDEALAAFSDAAGSVRRSYLDIPDYDLNIYWANTLAKKGDYDNAIKLYAPEALFMGREEALEGMKSAYTALNGGEKGFETFKNDMHAKIAKPVDDFELPDYEGKRYRLSDLRGDVTFLVFWFPT